MSIARDGSGVYGSFGNDTLTWSHTVNGPAPILWVGVRVGSATATATVTYNGQAMVNPTNAVLAAAGQTVYLFYVTGQTGTHNIVVTGSDSSLLVGYSMAFSDAAQVSGQPDASGNQQITGSSEFAATLTTVAANAWMIMFDYDSTDGPCTASSGSTLDVSGGTTAAIYSQGPYATPGSNSIHATPTGNHPNYMVFASFAPLADAIGLSVGIAEPTIGSSLF